MMESLLNIRVSVILFVVLAIPAYAQNSPNIPFVNIVQVADPRALVSTSDGSVYSKVLRSLREGIKNYVVVARREDAWIGQSDQSLRKLARQASDVIEAASTSPTFFPIEPYIREVKLKEEEKHAGVVSFVTVHLGETGIAQRPVIVPRPVPSGDGGKKIVLAPSPVNVARIFVLVLAVFGGVIAVAFSHRKRAMKKAEDEERKKTTRTLRNLDTLLQKNGIENHDEEKKTRSFFWAQPFLVIIAFVLLSTSVFAKSRALIDASGSMVRFRPEMKRIIEQEFLTSGPIDIYEFGDSTRFIRTVYSMADIDDVFSEMPVDSVTRISDGVAAMMKVAARRSGLTVMISDFRQDDNGNQVVGFGIPVGTDTASSAMTAESGSSPGSSFLPGHFAQVLLALSLLSLLAAVIFLRRGRLRDLKVSAFGHDANLDMSKAIGKKIKIGNDIDSSVRIVDRQVPTIHMMLRKKRSRYQFVVEVASDKTRIIPAEFQQ